MIETFQTLLTGVAAAALCGGVALSLTRGGALREVLRLACGLAVVLAVLEPLSTLRLPKLGASFRQTVAAGESQSTQYQAQSAQALAQAAIDQVEQYIEQRAAALGATVKAELAATSEADGRTLVTGVTLTASAADPPDKTAIETILVTECGIPKEFITWNWTE